MIGVRTERASASSEAGQRWKTKQVLFTTGYILAVVLVLYSLFGQQAYDDPFITYRYARNIGEGTGFVYNAGERILSTTTPLFALALAPFSRLGFSLPAAAFLIGAASLAAGAVCLWRLAGSWGTPEVGWAALLLYPFFPLVVSTLGSETPLYLALILGSFLFYDRKRYAGTAGLAALAVLARPDGILVPALLAFDYLVRVRRRVPWRPVVIFAGLLLSWAVFAWLYFGSPLPVTLAAKQHQGAMAASQRFFAGFFTTLSWYATWPYIVQAVFAGLGVFSLTGRGRPWRLILSWTVLYFTAFSILGVSRYFWYYSPLIPGFVILVGLGAGWIQTRVIKFGSRRMVWTGALLTTGLLLAGFYGQASSLAQMHLNPDPRYQAYRAVGEWLEQNTMPDDRVGALEVGIIGYYTQRPMIDFAGLIQPDVAAQLSMETTYQDAAIYAVERYKPEYLSLHRGVFPRLEEVLYTRGCQPVQEFPGASTGYEIDMVIYSCN